MHLSRIMSTIMSINYLDLSPGRECIDQWIHCSLFTSYISHYQLLSLLGTWLVRIGPFDLVSIGSTYKFKVVDLDPNN